MTRFPVWLLAAGWLCTAAAARPAPVCPGWPAFEQFAAHYISDDGRVIDASTPQQITTSEGQSYALFFALVAGDRKRFDQLLSWTRNNLAQGDLTLHLPAWKWGRGDDGQWRVLDANPAADADLWIAYDLIQAGRLWDARDDRILGKLIAHRIYQQETVALPGLGRALLPAPQGFKLDPTHWRLNPSYAPVQLLRALAAADPETGWPALLDSSRRLLLESAPAGFSPDWTVYDTATKTFQPDTLTHAVGSYGAIRVYLWAGMLATDDPDRTALLKQFLPMANRVAKDGEPPERVDTRTGQVHNRGPIGFSAALLPFLQAENASAAATLQAARLDAGQPLSQGYYNAVLTLFGRGFAEHRFRFSVDGHLEIPAENACAVASP